MNKINVIPVSKLNRYVKMILESDELLKGIYVTGEISNFKSHYSSGHLYFSLKDAAGAVQAVMFSREASRLKFIPENGMRVIVRCRVSVYEKTGNYQIYVDDMQPDGVGQLYIAYEQLKNKLTQEGLFDDERKREIPPFPEKIGVITAADGAARRDIENIIARRYPVAEIVFMGVLVQEKDAAKDISEAIQYFNKNNLADVLIVGRGGGSIEDLWAFNEEETVRSIASSKIPVISAVGHETDFTLSDFASDLRAPTPSAAAELCVPDIFRLKEDIREKTDRMYFSLKTKIDTLDHRVKIQKDKHCMKSPLYYAESRSAELSMASVRFEESFCKILQSHQNRLSVCASKLDSLSPLKVLARGYGIATDMKKGTILSSVTQPAAGDKINLRLSDGNLICTVDNKIKEQTNNHAEENDI